MAEARLLSRRATRMRQLDGTKRLVVLAQGAPTTPATPSSESSEVRWAPAPEVHGYTMDRSMRIRINDVLTPGNSPVVT